MILDPPRDMLPPEVFSIIGCNEAQLVHLRYNGDDLWESQLNNQYVFRYYGTILGSIFYSSIQIGEIQVGHSYVVYIEAKTMKKLDTTLFEVDVDTIRILYDTTSRSKIIDDYTPFFRAIWDKSSVLNPKG